MTPAPHASSLPAHAVEIRGLWTIFGQGDNAFVVHSDLNLDVHRGEVLTLVGGSGTGKSVLLRQILGLTHPARGEVRVFGQSVEEIARQGMSQRIGMLFQQGALFSSFSVLDNIALALNEMKTLPAPLVYDAAMVKLRLAGLKPEHATRMPSELSGGMVKRAALARALIMDPPLLLLDEPTAGLDPESADDFCQLLRELHQELKLTVIMVTHDLDTLFSLSTRVAVLADKKIVALDTPQNVARVDHPFIRRYFLGERGRRAMAPLPDAPDNAAASAPKD